jgi:hypothetical protein
MRNKASHRRRLFGRRQRRLVEAAERPQQEEEIPNLMRPEGWARCWSCKESLNCQKFKIRESASDTVPRLRNCVRYARPARQTSLPLTFTKRAESFRQIRTGSALLILEDVHDPTCLLCTLQ